MHANRYVVQVNSCAYRKIADDFVRLVGVDGDVGVCVFRLFALSRVEEKRKTSSWKFLDILVKILICCIIQNY